MTDETLAVSPVNKALSLAEALDFPTRKLVCVTLDNPLLTRLAAASDIGESTWRSFSDWMESAGTEDDRLRELRQEYYSLFLRPASSLSVYLHDWYPDRPAQELLGDLRRFLDSVALAKARDFRSGQDHISLVLEVLAFLVSENREEVARFNTLYLRPWFGVFASRLHDQARSPFYIAAARLAGGLERELEDLV